MDLFGNEVIRTLGLHQPYASLMWTDDKIETRWVQKGKKAPFPLGKYMLYATGKVMKIDEVERISGVFLRKEKWVNDLRYSIVGCPLIICDLIKVSDWLSHENSFSAQMQATAFVKYMESDTHRLVRLYFANKQRIKQFPFKGKQGVGILTPEQKEMIEFL